MPKKIRVTYLNRREMLKLSGAAWAGAALLPACIESQRGDDGEAPAEELPAPQTGPSGNIEPITSNAQFYTQQCCGVQDVDGAAWSLDIFSDGELVGQITEAVLLGLTLREKEHTLQCIGSSPDYRAINNAVWGGLPLREVLDAIAVVPDPSAIEQVWRCADDYHTSLPISDLDTMWLVWQMNGVPLPPEHGYPARLLTPGRYGTKNPKWPVSLSFERQAHTGYWEGRGWSNSAQYNTNGFILEPRDLAIVDVESIRILGTAFSGPDPVTGVEITTDDGLTWQDTEITYSPGPDIWTLWAYDWRPTETGVHVLRIRVSTASGSVSHENPAGTDRYSGYDGAMMVRLDVV